MSEIEQAFEQAMDRMQAEMPDAPPWREIAEERPEEVQTFRRFIDHFAEEFSRSQSERVSRLEEALKPFAMFALEGKRGGEFIICKGLFADMKDWDDSPPRECHLHKDDFLRARSALNQGADDGR